VALRLSWRFDAAAGVRSNIPVTSVAAGESHSQMEGFQAEGDGPRIPTLLYELPFRDRSLALAWTQFP